MRPPSYKPPKMEGCCGSCQHYKRSYNGHPYCAFACAHYHPRDGVDTAGTCDEYTADLSLLVPLATTPNPNPAQHSD